MDNIGEVINTTAGFKAAVRLKEVNEQKGRVLLVNPGINSIPINKSMGMFPNNGTMILGTILKQHNFDVQIIDGRYLSIDEVISQVLSLADDDLIFVGFGIMTIQLKYSYLVSSGIKKKNPNIKTVWGGVHPTLFPKETVSDDAVDVVVVNQCASTIVDLADTIAENTDLKNIPGICYKADGKIISTPSNCVGDDFDIVPYLDFSILNHEAYSRNNNVAMDSTLDDDFKKYIVYPINTALGCNFKCTFCINEILQTRHLLRSAEEIVDRIKFLQKEYGANYIHFNDENFFANKERIYKFVELIRREKIKIKWRPSVNACYFNKKYINEEFVKELEESGMIIAVMGFESGSVEMLKRLKKPLRVDAIYRSIDTLSKTKIISRASFMTGLPGETEEEMQETYDLALDLEKRYPEFQGNILPFRLYPGSPLYDEAVKEYGYTPPGSIAEWIKFEDSEIVESVGYQHSSHYPWIPNKNKFELRNKIYRTYQKTQWNTQRLGGTSNKNFQEKIKYYLFLSIFKLSRSRLRNQYYKFHFENKLLKLLLDIRQLYFSAKSLIISERPKHLVIKHKRWPYMDHS